MLRSWLKTAWRYSRNSKLYSFLNLAGLATGSAAAILITLWARDELSFDCVHQYYNRIAQVMDNQPADGAISTGELLPIPLAADLRDHYGDDFSRVALYWPNFRHILNYGDKSIAQYGSWVQPDLPVMLTLSMLRGSSDALKDRSLTLITRSLAQALFGSADPMGRTIRVDNAIEVKVGGVFEDLPPNSTFSDAKIFLPLEKAVDEMSWLKDYTSAWDAHGWKLFVQLSEHADIDRVNRNIQNIIGTHVRSSGETLFLHPMRQWHLYSEFSNGINTGGRIRFVRLFAGIGGLILLLACINFMNLATARSGRRAKEVGIRKVVGSLRYQLIGQFFGEALLVTVSAVILALGIAQLSLPIFNSLAGKKLALPFNDPLFDIGLLGFIFFTALLAGSYPAFYLSHFRPVKVLKGDLRSGPWSSLPRKVLVVLQFTISISLIIGTIFVNGQIQFAKDRPVGYSRSGLLTIGKNTSDLYQARYETLRDDLLRTGVVSDMAESTAPATELPAGASLVEWPGEAPGSRPTFSAIGITPEYGRTIGWQVTMGRDFDPGLARDSDKVIINETAARLIGSQQLIGKNIRVWGLQRMVVGVVRDMVMGSPFRQTVPGAFLLVPATSSNDITIRVQPAIPMQTALAAIGKVFRKYNPASPFDFQFADTEYALKFADEERIDGLSRAFTLLAIGISCLGLFGLAAYSTEQRTREIGIRKVLGSSGFRIWELLTREVLWLIGLSCVIAIPLSAIFMHRWLQQYEYRTPLSFWVFCIASIGALLIALVTVSFHALRAARTNPIKSLRAS